ncbi:MAG: endospore germination permease [Desulfitobacteriaceae bacterium]|nr:endospore germination permease [Desulfitobacteriaceae bacterium]MDI6916109.1 endospore germination permease [Desulfitobacteriaceae bacterium]
MNVAKISSRQFTWLTISITLATPVLILPEMIIYYARQNAWLALLLGTLATLAGVMLNLALARKFPGQSIVQYAQILLGPWLGKLIGMLYALAFLYLTGVCLNIIAQIIEISLLPETPLWTFILGLSLFAVYSAWLGIEPIARANDLLLPPNLLIAGSILLLALPHGKLYQGLPVTQLNLTAILKGAFPPAACLSEIFFILMLAPSLNKPEELKSATLKGLLFSSFFLTFVTQAFLFVLGVYRASIYLFPALRLSEELMFLDIFERFESLILTLWILLNALKLSVFTYLYALTAAQTFNRKSYKGFLLPALLFLPVLALIPRNLAEILQVWLNTFSFKLVLPAVFLFLPGLLLMIAKVKHHV